MKCSFRKWKCSNGTYDCQGGIYNGLMCENEHPDLYMCEWSENFHLFAKVYRKIKEEEEDVRNSKH